MGLSAGDEVRAYNSPNYRYEVVETNVEEDVDVPDARHVWRLPEGNTLLKNTEKRAYYMVVPKRLVSPV